MSKKSNGVKRRLTVAAWVLLSSASTLGSAGCGLFTRTKTVEVKVPVERVAACHLPPVPLPEVTIEATGCGDAVCMTPEAVWALDRWLSALERWVAQASACPGVVVGPSGVTEELDKLR